MQPGIDAKRQPLPMARARFIPRSGLWSFLPKHKPGAQPPMLTVLVTRDSTNVAPDWGLLCHLDGMDNRDQLAGVLCGILPLAPTHAQPSQLGALVAHCWASMQERAGKRAANSVTAGPLTVAQATRLLPTDSQLYCAWYVTPNATPARPHYFGLSMPANPAHIWQCRTDGVCNNPSVAQYLRQARRAIGLSI